MSPTNPLVTSSSKPFVRTLLVLGGLSCGLTASLLVAGCSSEVEAPIHFEHETPFLPDFEKDSGYLPAGAEAQVRVLAKASGSFRVEADGMPGNGELVPMEESGRATLGAQLSFEVFAKLDIASIKFDDVVASMVYEIPAAESVFTPFLLADTATMQVLLPAQTLGTVPIPSVPGASVRLDIAGGQLDLGLTGTCAKSDASLAQFMATMDTSGTVNLAATVVVEVPFVGTKEFGPFSISVPVPATQSTLDLGTYRRDGSLSDEVGPCMRADDNPSGGDSGTGGGLEPDAVNCGLPSRLEISGIQPATVTQESYENGAYYGLKFDLEDFIIEALAYDPTFEVGQQGSYRARTKFGSELDFKVKFASKSEGRIDLSTADWASGNYAGTLHDATFRQTQVNGTPIPDGCVFRVEQLNFSGRL